MGVKVVKFGGSSLADANQFHKVRQIVQSDPQRRYVVPSAPGKRSYKDEKITDLLYTCAKMAAEGENIGEPFSHITERYVDIAFELELEYDVLPVLHKVREDIEAGAGPDYAASRGEYINGLLLAAYLGYDFVDAAEVICFDATGQYNSEQTMQKIQKMSVNHERAVIPGFYGALPDGGIKTFSRGGSDITGAIVAQGVDAEIYENWTDVSGLLMADPRVVNNPRTIRTVTYSELRELSYMGASVLHDEAVFPVRQASIPINVRNTNAPEDPGTMILAETNCDQAVITGIAGKAGFTVLALEKDKMNGEVGFAAGVLDVLRENGVSIEHMPTGIDTMSVVVADHYLEGKRQRIVDDIIARVEPDSLEMQDKMALLAVVGRNMAGRVGTSGKIFTALAAANVNVRMIDQGSSEMNIIIGVESASLNAAVNAIYNELAGDES